MLMHVLLSRGLLLLLLLLLYPVQQLFVIYRDVHNDMRTNTHAGVLHSAIDNVQVCRYRLRFVLVKTTVLINQNQITNFPILRNRPMRFRD